MKHKTLSLVLACLIAVPMLFADNTETEVEIQLYEVVNSGFISGDDPLDNPNHGSATPTRPNDFHATITGHTLAVTADNANTTTVVVYNNTGKVVVNQQFVGYTIAQLGTIGNYTIEIHNSTLTLVGEFNAE